MSISNTYYIDTKGRLITGLNKSSLVKRIKEGIFTEAQYIAREIARKTSS